MMINDTQANLSHQFYKGQLVVFKNICYQACFYPDHLHEVVKVLRKHNHLEIKETKCWHHNRRRWGSDGSDIRPATQEEISARSRLPKTIHLSRDNPQGLLRMKHGRTDIFSLKHYTTENNLLIKAEDGELIEVNIYDVLELEPNEIQAYFLLKNPLHAE